MTQFIQLHLLTTYPPSNPNRDDLGRPKTARFGNAERMRISSQALKRSVRISNAFETKLKVTGNMADRTQRLGRFVAEHLKQGGMDEERTISIARVIADAFGEPKKEEESMDIEQLAFISPKERQLALKLADDVLSGQFDIASFEKIKNKDKRKAAINKLISEFGLLQKADGAVDLAMFGRMLADNPDFNREAAVQVAHAITTNQIQVESDYYTAVDDLKKPTEDAGSSFIGELGFGSGVFYIYACINYDLLVKNLAGDEELAAKGVEALVEALATSSPSGKKNSFAHGGRAEYVLAERGAQQPRTLASAFLKPVDDEDLMQASVRRLEKFCKQMDTAYSPCASDRMIMNAGDQKTELKDTELKPLADVAAFCAQTVVSG